MFAACGEPNGSNSILTKLEVAQKVPPGRPPQSSVRAVQGSADRQALLETRLMYLVLNTLRDFSLVVLLILFVVDSLSRLLYLLAIGLAFAPSCEHRMRKLLEVATPAMRRVMLVGTRRMHERIATPWLFLLAMFPRTEKFARRILAILGT